jgi:hypothetical protein
MNKAEARLYADYRQAAGLLLDSNLVWSADMEPIRVGLGLHIAALAFRGDFTDFNILGIVKSLIADENDVSI